VHRHVLDYEEWARSSVRLGDLLQQCVASCHTLRDSLMSTTVAVEKSASFRKACVVCGRKKGVKFQERQFLYVKPALLLVMVFIGWIAVPLFRRMFQRSARLNLPYCSPCGEAALRSKDLQGPVTIGALVVLLGVATAGLNGAPIVAAGIAVVGISLVVVAYYMLVARGMQVQVVRIDDTAVWLRGAHPDALPLPSDDESRD